MSEATEPNRLTVFLHVGTMKSGTSYLQSGLKQHAEGLREAGVLFPPWPKQVAGAREMRDEQSDRSRWNSICEQLSAWTGPTAIISAETMSFSTKEQAVGVVDSLRPADVRVVITGRDIVRVLPSAWQTSLKNGFSWTLDEYVSAAQDAGRSSGAAQHFWRRQDLVQLADTWSAAIDGQSVDLVTVPPRGSPPDLLWARFCSVVGLDPSFYVVTEVENSNPSLSTVEAEVMRSVNLALPNNLGRRRKSEIRKIFANELLRGSAGGKVPVLPRAGWPWAVSYSENLVRALADGPVRVTGDLTDLLPGAPPTGDEPPAVDSSADRAAVAVRAAGRVMVELAQTGDVASNPPRRPGQRRAEGPSREALRAARKARRRARRAARAGTVEA